MTDNEICLPKIDGTDFFNHLKNNSANKVFSTLYDFIKTVTDELSEEQSFYVLDFADILWKIQLWKEKLPGIKPFYAVKANSDPLLIRLFVLLGFSFDCSTKGEIDLILKCGGSPKDIIYAHTVKPSSSLKYALEVGVDFMTFDSSEELYKIKKHIPNAKLVLRIKADTPKRSYDLSGKFGCPVDKTKELLLVAKDLNLNVVGVSFHVGALCEDPEIYTKTIRNCRVVFDEAEQLGFQFTVLDLGAGFFGSSIKDKYFDELASELKESVQENFLDNDVEVIAEPGCYFVGSSQKYVTCVLGRKSVDATYRDYADNKIERLYYLNDGYYGSFFHHIELYDIYPKPVLERKELNKRLVYKSKIWGQTCCSEDVIQEECLLPEMETGEFLVWENMGAYTQGVASTFTIVPLPVPKRVFIQNLRLTLNWIKNFKEITELLAENVILIEDENFP